MDITAAEDFPDVRSLLKLLFGVAAGAAAALVVLSLSRSGRWGQLVMTAPTQKPEEESPEQAMEARSEPRAVVEESSSASESRKTLILEDGEPWLSVCAITHQGLVRGENQDRFVLKELGEGQGALAVVADGMGGHSGGSVASEIAAQTIGEALGQVAAEPSQSLYDSLVKSFHDADQAIRRQASKDVKLRGMGTTAVAVVVGRDFAVHAHTGDSRLYHFRGGKQLYRTRDHSVVRYLQEEGLVSEADARCHPMRSRLTSSLGGSPPERKITVEPRWQARSQEQAAILRLQPGDLLLLCSDGLNSEVEPDQMSDLVAGSGDQAAQLAGHLLNAALEGGGRDNVTVIVIRRER